MMVSSALQQQHYPAEHPLQFSVLKIDMPYFLLSAPQLKYHAPLNKHKIPMHCLNTKRVKKKLVVRVEYFLTLADSA